MLSRVLGELMEIDGEEVLLTRRDDRGHAVALQQDHRRPGVYRVDFPIELRDAGAPTPDTVCAHIDVTAADGHAILAARDVRVGDLAAGGMQSLTFTLRGFRALEYRVALNGQAALRLMEPRIVKISDEIGQAPPVDPLRDTTDPVELGEQVRAVLRMLRPMQAKDRGKTRLGNMGDGGCVCLDDFEGVDTAFSFGINNDVSWDLDAAARGMTVYQFDHTVDDPTPDDPRLFFEKKMIAPITTSTSQNLSDLVRRHDKRHRRPNLMLKMDIEDYEWPLIEATPPSDLARFTQIVCEMHRFNFMSDAHDRRAIYLALRKLTELYGVVHVHANACAGMHNIGNVYLPGVLEVTFVNRELYNLVETDELFPGPLDQSCHAHAPDIFLGSFRY